MKLWVIALKDSNDPANFNWGYGWAYNRMNWSASDSGDVFLDISEVKNWLEAHQSYWEKDGRDFCVYCEDINLEEWK